MRRRRHVERTKFTRKGPRWSDVHKEGTNLIETIESGGYVRKFEEHGRTRVVLECPFCSAKITAYVWSLGAGGKRCGCGALAGSNGAFHHFADREKDASNGLG